MSCTKKSVPQGRNLFSSCTNKNWYPCPPPDPKPECCRPEIGNLVSNGTFEIGVCGAGWSCTGNVKPMDQNPDTGHNAHQGTGAVALGLNEQDQGGDGSISQIVEGLCPDIAYEFSFFMSPDAYAPNIRPTTFETGASNDGNAEFIATLTFLDKHLNPINEAIEILVPADTLAWAYIWTYYKTIAIAPPGTRFALIKFAVSEPPGYFSPNEHVHIDDVSLVAL
jgi:hypothetical protein